MHDGNGGITYSRDPNGNISGEIPEVVVTSSRHTGNALIGAVANANTLLDGIGASLKKNGGNSTFGSNYRFYWHKANERGFYGNQHVSTERLTTIGQKLSKYTGPIGKILDGKDIYDGYKQDNSQIGYYTIRATTGVAGGWAGAAIGAKAGAAIGLCSGGVGAVPATIILGVAGGIVGSLGGNWIGTQTIDIIYGF